MVRFSVPTVWNRPFLERKGPKELFEGSADEPILPNASVFDLFWVGAIRQLKTLHYTKLPYCSRPKKSIQCKRIAEPKVQRSFRKFFWFSLPLSGFLLAPRPFKQA